jgi:flagellar biosynthesis/type III secretory pathway protein FliH
MPSSSKVIKAAGTSVFNPLKIDGLDDFNTDNTQVSTVGSSSNKVSVEEDKSYKPDITWTTGKFAGEIREKPQTPIHSWVVSDFQREPSNTPTKLQQPVSYVAEKVDDHARLIDEAKVKADDVISEAEKNAEEILAQARKEAENIKQNAFSEGMASARSEMSQTLHQVERLFQETQLWQEQVMRQSQTRIIEMVMAIGKKLFGSGFELPSEQIDHYVSRAINEASRLGNLRVYLHPEDAKLLVNLWQESELTLNGQQIQIVSSQNISRGGCFIDGEFGVLDGRVEEQFDQINKSIKSTEVNLEVEE